MIPNPGYPSQEQASRAMAQADDFVRRTRDQSYQQMQAQYHTYTGGAQPGVMSYAAGAGAAAYRGAAGAAGAGATMMGMGAAAAQPISREIMQAGAGARAGMMPQGFFGLLTTAYAPAGMLPHAATSFHMESGLRREFAQEELGRRWDMFGRRAATTSADLLTLGISSHIMRRTGVEARIFTEMSTERLLQQQLGVTRGMGSAGSASGFGVNRAFLTEGAGSEAMEELMGGAAGLQSKFGYNRKQLDLLTGQALGALDPTRITAAARGGGGGMKGLGQEARQIRDEMARMAREMQITEEQIPQFFDSLKGVLRVSGAGLAGFREETRRAGLQGPFSQMQATQITLQGQTMGRGLYMDPGNMGRGAFSRALEVAQLRERGVITADTLMREGGGYGTEAMQRMAMQRLGIQAQAVQGGQFNRELILAQANPAAYQNMLGGAGFFQTQGAVAGALMRDPFALLRARLNPETRERVTMDADLSAFRGAQQMIPMLPGGRDSAVGIFAQKMGMTLEQAQPWYEEHEVRLGSARGLAGKLGLAGGDQGAQNVIGDVLVSMSRRTGMSVTDLGAAAQAAAAGGKSLGNTTEEIEANITRGRAGLAQSKFGSAQSKLFGGLRSAEATSAAALISSIGSGGLLEGGGMLHSKIGTNMAFAAWDRAQLGRRLNAKERNLAGAVSTLFRVGASPAAMRDAIDEARYALGPGASTSDIEARTLGSAANWESEEQGKTRSVSAFGLTLNVAAFTATRTRVALVDNEFKLQRQRLELSREERAVNATFGYEPGEIAGMGRWVDVSSEALTPNSPALLAAQIRLANATGTAGGTLQEFIGTEKYKDLRRSASRTFGALQGMGVLDAEATRGKFTSLLNMETEKPELFKSIENTPAYGPLSRVIRGFTSGGTLQDTESAMSAVPEKQLQSLVKQFSKGRDIDVRTITGTSESFKSFVQGLGPEQQEFSRQMLQAAVAQSDRLVKSMPLGSGIGAEMWVRWQGQKALGEQ